MAMPSLVASLMAFITSIGLIWNQPVIAALPLGNPVKDPYALLRNALPIEQKELRELQHKLEDTSDLIKENRWPSVNKAASAGTFIVSNKQSQILDAIPAERESEGKKILNQLKGNLEHLSELASEKNKSEFIDQRLICLRQIGDLEDLVMADEFPYKIPETFNNLPRLLGRATVSIETTKGNMTAVIDGYNAPITAGNFIDLAQKGFYDGLPFSRAEDFYIIQTGDPKGPEIGYIDPETNEERHIPLEIRIPGKKEPIYNQTFEELGLYTETPVLPFATLGTLGWAHSGEALDDGSSQFFFFLYEAELNPAGKNLRDGRNAAFGYVVEGDEILNKLGVKDEIRAIKVLDGASRLKPTG